MTHLRYELSQRESNRRYLIKLMDDDDILLTSQYREIKPMCLNEIDWMRKIGGDDGFYERLDDVDGTWSFVLHARDAHILARSQPFASREQREQAIVRVRKAVGNADVVDLTEDVDLETRIPTVLRDYARKVVSQSG